MNKAEAKKLIGQEVFVGVRAPSRFMADVPGVLEGMVRGMLVSRGEDSCPVYGMSHSYYSRSRFVPVEGGDAIVWAVKMPDGTYEYSKTARHLFDAKALRAAWEVEKEKARVRQIQTADFEARVALELPSGGSVYKHRREVIFNRAVDVPEGWDVKSITLVPK